MKISGPPSLGHLRRQPCSTSLARSCPLDHSFWQRARKARHDFARRRCCLEKIWSVGRRHDEPPIHLPFLGLYAGVTVRWTTTTRLPDCLTLREEASGRSCIIGALFSPPRSAALVMPLRMGLRGVTTKPRRRRRRQLLLRDNAPRPLRRRALAPHPLLVRRRPRPPRPAVVPQARRVLHHPPCARERLCPPGVGARCERPPRATPVPMPPRSRLQRPAGAPASDALSAKSPTPTRLRRLWHRRPQPAAGACRRDGLHAGREGPARAGGKAPPGHGPPPRWGLCTPFPPSGCLFSLARFPDHSYAVPAPPPRRRQRLQRRQPLRVPPEFLPAVSARAPAPPALARHRQPRHVQARAGPAAPQRRCVGRRCSLRARPSQRPHCAAASAPPGGRILTCLGRSRLPRAPRSQAAQPLTTPGALPPSTCTPGGPTRPP